MLVGEVEDALEEFRRALAIAPEQTRDILRYAIIPELEAWAEQHEPTVQTRYVLAQAYFLAERWAGRLGPAGAQLQRALRRTPRRARSSGAAYLKSGQLDLAEEALRTALRRDDSLAEAHDTLASVYAAAGRYDEALEVFGRAQELDPAHVGHPLQTRGSRISPPASPVPPRPRSGRCSVWARPTTTPGPSWPWRWPGRAGATRPARSSSRSRSASLSGPSSCATWRRSTSSPATRRRRSRHLQLAKKGGIDVQAVEALIAGGRPASPRGRGRRSHRSRRRPTTAPAGTTPPASCWSVRRRRTPREPQVHYWLGRVALDEKDEERAREPLPALARGSTPDFLPVAVRAGPARLRRRGLRRGGVAARAVRGERGRPTAARTSCWEGASSSSASWTEAEEHLRTAIRKRSDYGNSFYFLARVLLEQGRDEEARRELELAVDSRSLPEWRREDAHLRLARLLDAAGEGERGGGSRQRRPASRCRRRRAPPVACRSLPTDRIELVRVAPSHREGARPRPGGPDRWPPSASTCGAPTGGRCSWPPRTRAAPPSCGPSLGPPWSGARERSPWRPRSRPRRAVPSSRSSWLSTPREAETTTAATRARYALE